MHRGPDGDPDAPRTRTGTSSTPSRISGRSRKRSDRANDLNRITKIKIDVGALAPIDIVQTEVTIAQREQDIITAEGLIGDAQDRLRRLLNVQSIPDWNRPIVPTDRPTRESLQAAFPTNVDQGYETALKARPEIKQALLNIESKKVTHAYTKNQLMPRLDLSGGYGLAGLGANGLGIDNPDGNPDDLTYSTRHHADRPRRLPELERGRSCSPFRSAIARAKGNYAIANADLELARTNFAIAKANLNVEVRAAARAIDTAYRTVAGRHEGARARRAESRRREEEVRERHVDDLPGRAGRRTTSRRP